MEKILNIRNTYLENGKYLLTLLLIVGCSNNQISKETARSENSLKRPGYDYPVKDLSDFEFKISHNYTAKIKENPIQEKFIITGDIVNMRTAPDLSSTVVSSIKINEEIDISRIVISPFIPYADPNLFFWLKGTYKNKNVYLSYNFATPVRKCKEVFEGKICYQYKCRTKEDSPYYRDIVFFNNTKSWSLGNEAIHGVSGGSIADAGGALKYSTFNFEFIFAGILMNEPVIVYRHNLEGGEGGDSWEVNYLHFIKILNNKIIYLGYIPINKFQYSSDENSNYFKSSSILKADYNNNLIEYEFTSEIGLYSSKQKAFSPKKTKKRYYKINNLTDIKNFQMETENIQL